MFPCSLKPLGGPHRCSNRRNLKTLASRFSVDGKHFETELFENDDVTIIT